VAQRMTESFHTAPHFYLGVEANAAALVRLRDQLLGPGNQQAGVRLTYTDLFFRAMAVSLREHPQVNAYWSEDAIKLRDSIDIGFAVQTADGLVVPVIRNADGLALFDLASQRQILAEKAKAGKLSLPEMEGGSATLSNLGNSNIDWFQAILNPPQSVILATGRIAKRAVVVNDSLAVCPTLVLSLSVDHRVLDGVAGANFLGRIKELIENPSVTLE
jgi:pyruvate dehydrogenase E2 component (dihydrolipoamide acetyltransferase)